MFECEAAYSLLVKALRACIAAVECDCILLSGGLDTTAIALLSILEGIVPKAITVYYVGGLPRDLHYAIHVAKFLGLEHRLVALDDRRLAVYASKVRECIGQVDYIEVRNDIIFLAGLEEAKRIGCKCVYTGDGGDELLSGYKFMILEGAETITSYRLRFAAYGRYPNLELGECIGLEVYAPFLCDEFIEVAVKTPPACLFSQGLAWEGKEPLRRLLEDYGLSWIAERVKTPAEAGGGTDHLDEVTLRRVTREARII